MKNAVFFFAAAVVLLSVGCGTNQPSCAITAIHVSPTSASADHAAASPGNTALFLVIEDLPSGCARAAVRTFNEIWTVSDTDHATISNAHDSTYGLATCTGSAAAPITVTATLPTGTGQQALTATATLTCR